jgi:hypothetical protein
MNIKVMKKKYFFLKLAFIVLVSCYLKKNIRVKNVKKK